MADRKHVDRRNGPDLAHVIQSIQRIEGNPDCFGTAEKNCDRGDCLWREYCLKKAPPEPVLNQTTGRAIAQTGGRS